MMVAVRYFVSYLYFKEVSSEKPDHDKHTLARDLEVLFDITSSCTPSTIDDVFLLLRSRQRDLLLLLWRHGASCKDNFHIGTQLQLQQKTKSNVKKTIK